MRGADERFAVYDVTLKGSPLLLEVRKSAAGLCQLPEGMRVRARGLPRDGRMEVTHPPNLERLE